MFLIAGLGNPGTKYYNTRHNIGFLVIDKLAEYFKLNSFKEEELYIAALAEYNETNIVLMKPLTYMNLSGRAVKEFTDRFKIPKENILIVYDDVNLDFGTLRLRPSGSDGGQNGIKSVIYEFESEEIPRLRIGIRNSQELDRFKDKAEGTLDLASYVLSEFTPDEKKELDTVAGAARDAVLSLVKAGISETMNIFNKNFLEEKN